MRVIDSLAKNEHYIQVKDVLHQEKLENAIN